MQSVFSFKGAINYSALSRRTTFKQTPSVRQHDKKENILPLGNTISLVWLYVHLFVFITSVFTYRTGERKEDRTV
jgi:hypothetical protein